MIQLRGFSDPLIFALFVIWFFPSKNLWAAETSRDPGAVSRRTITPGQEAAREKRSADDELKIQVKNPYPDEVPDASSHASRWGLWYESSARGNTNDVSVQGVGLSYWRFVFPTWGFWSGFNLGSSQWFGAGQVRDQAEVFFSLRPQLETWGAWSLSAALGVSYLTSREYVRGSGLPLQSVDSSTPFWVGLQLSRAVSSLGLVSVQVRGLETGSGLIGVGWEWF